MLGPIVSIIAGFLVLAFPKLVRLILGIYLIVVGLVQLVPWF